jgi:hypothetical protein
VAEAYRAISDLADEIRLSPNNSPFPREDASSAAFGALLCHEHGLFGVVRATRSFAETRARAEA